MAINTPLKDEIQHKVGAKPVVPSSAPSESLITNDFLHKTTHAAGHDLRSPLFVIRSYGHLLQKTQDKSRLKRGFKLIEDATYKMEQTINGFVDLIDIYTLPFPAKEMVSFQSAFEYAKLELADLIDQFQPNITFNFTSVSEVFFNEKYLVKIMTCLIDNAIRHNAEKGNLQVIVTSERINNETILVIQDNGKGIVDELEEEKINTPFYSFSDDEKCIGIGLSKVQAIAKVSQSNFHLRSQPDEFTICHFVFK